jgi:hypothetical protein
MSVLKIGIGIAAGMLGLVGIGWLGTKIELPALPTSTAEGSNLGTVELSADLPAPVLRYIENSFNGEVPRVESAIISGTAEVIFGGITFPARFRFYHAAGSAYYHYIQMGWFGQPIATVNERYADGTAILDIPGTLVQNDPHTDSAANLALWAESIWLPSIWFSDPRLRWEAVDDDTARLIVPNAAREESLTIHFDPQTGLIDTLTTMRYQGQDSTTRLQWTNRVVEWREFNGVLLPSRSETQWQTDAPWAIWHVQQVQYNVPVAERLAQFGGTFED